jgi:hypothetical protein
MQQTRRTLWLHQFAVPQRQLASSTKLVLVASEVRLQIINWRNAELVMYTDHCSVLYMNKQHVTVYLHLLHRNTINLFVFWCLLLLSLQLLRLPLIMLTQLSTFYITQLKSSIYFNIILPSTPRSFKFYLPLKLSKHFSSSPSLHFSLVQIFF